MIVLRGRGGEWLLERCFRLEHGEDAIVDFLRNQLVLVPDDTTAYIERVTGFGGGIGLKLRENYGFLRGVLKMRGIHVTDVRPQVWMAEMGVEGKSQTAEKRQSMRRLAAGVQDAVETTNWNAAGILIAYYALGQETGRGLLGDSVRA
jgi:hypothetical protein